MQHRQKQVPVHAFSKVPITSINTTGCDCQAISTVLQRLYILLRWSFITSCPDNQRYELLVAFYNSLPSKCSDIHRPGEAVLIELLNILYTCPQQLPRIEATPDKKWACILADVIDAGVEPGPQRQVYGCDVDKCFQYQGGKWAVHLQALERLGVRVGSLKLVDRPSEWADTSVQYERCGAGANEQQASKRPRLQHAFTSGSVSATSSQPQPGSSTTSTIATTRTTGGSSFSPSLIGPITHPPPTHTQPHASSPQALPGNMRLPSAAHLLSADATTTSSLHTFGTKSTANCSILRSNTRTAPQPTDGTHTSNRTKRTVRFTLPELASAAPSSSTPSDHPTTSSTRRSACRSPPPSFSDRGIPPNHTSVTATLGPEPPLRDAPWRPMHAPAYASLKAEADAPLPPFTHHPAFLHHAQDLPGPWPHAHASNKPAVPYVNSFPVELYHPTAYPIKPDPAVNATPVSSSSAATTPHTQPARRTLTAPATPSIALAATTLTATTHSSTTSAASSPTTLLLPPCEPCQPPCASSNKRTRTACRPAPAPDPLSTAQNTAHDIERSMAAAQAAPPAPRRSARLSNKRGGVGDGDAAGSHLTAAEPSVPQLTTAPVQLPAECTAPSARMRSNRGRTATAQQSGEQQAKTQDDQRQHTTGLLPPCVTLTSAEEHHRRPCSYDDGAPLLPSQPYKRGIPQVNPTQPMSITPACNTPTAAPLQPSYAHYPKTHSMPTHNPSIIPAQSCIKQEPQDKASASISWIPSADHSNELHVSKRQAGSSQTEAHMRQAPHALPCTQALNHDSFNRPSLLGMHDQPQTQHSALPATGVHHGDSRLVSVNSAPLDRKRRAGHLSQEPFADEPPFTESDQHVCLGTHTVRLKTEPPCVEHELPSQLNWRASNHAPYARPWQTAYQPHRKSINSEQRDDLPHAHQQSVRTYAYHKNKQQRMMFEHDLRAPHVKEEPVEEWVCNDLGD